MSTSTEEETMDEPEAGPTPAEKKAIGKRVAAVRHRIKHPEKEGRQAWTPEELARLEARLEELEAERGPVAGGRRPAVEGWDGDNVARPAKAVKRNAWDDLAARRGHMARFRGDEAAAPTVDQLLKHAAKFGTETILECAAELGYGHDAMERLADGLDRIDAAAYRKEHPKAPPPSFGDAGKRVESLIGPREAAA